MLSTFEHFMKISLHLLYVLEKVHNAIYEGQNKEILTQKLMKNQRLHFLLYADVVENIIPQTTKFVPCQVLYKLSWSFLNFRLADIRLLLRNPIIPIL